MQFLRTAFWVALVIVIMVFSVTNWTSVSINLWGGNQLITKLPIVVIVAFLAGSLPFWALHKATRWRLRRKLDTAERALAAAVPPVGMTTSPPAFDTPPSEILIAPSPREP